MFVAPALPIYCTADVSPQLVSPTPSRADSRRELDNLIQSLVEGRPGSGGPRDPSSPAGGRGSRPTSVISAGQLSSIAGETFDSTSSPPASTPTTTTVPQTLTIAPLTTVYESPSTPKPEIITYSKGVQTTEPWTPPQRRQSVASTSEAELDGPDWSPSKAKRASKRMSRMERQRDEELRQNLRREIEEELKALQNEGAVADDDAEPKFPARALNDEELNAVTSSEEFLDFVERSSKVIERALDEEYDLLVDYALAGVEEVDDDDDGFGTAKGKKGRRVREVTQFYDERWSKKRMISDLSFSQKVLSFHYATAETVHLQHCSSRSLSWHLTRRTLRHRMTLMVSSKSGICICMTGPNTFSTPSPTS